MASQLGDQKAEKSYLTTAVESINPWGGKRDSSPAPEASKKADKKQTSEPAPEGPGDHSITHLYGQSFRTYPADCPPLKVQWYHAIDVPKRKGVSVKERQKLVTNEKPVQKPKKFSAFSISDSRAIESRYQQLLEATESPTKAPHKEISQSVPVNEDFLFDVVIDQRELSPVYWLGPVYEVRRGTWFFQEGTSLRPCEENLAAQLEEGYLKTKPWRSPARSRSQSVAKSVTPKQSQGNLKAAPGKDATANPPETVGQTTGNQPQSYRLFGSHMNSFVTYQDGNIAWLSTDTMLSWVTSSMYERFSGGGYMSGIKLVRGYTEPTKPKESELQEKDKSKTPVSATAEDVPGLDHRQQKLLNRRSAPPSTKAVVQTQEADPEPTKSTAIEGRGARLQRQLSSLMEGGNPIETEEQMQERQEQEMRDYHTQAGESQKRDVDHLILVTHGIGQQLGLRMESINFVQDVNVLRKTLKSTYASSADLKALNSELNAELGNCRVQVLPVCWRHLLDFPRQRERKEEHDLGDVDDLEDNYPSLEDITIEGVAFARSLISDLALDVLLYQSSYREQIASIVLQECNRIYRLYCDRNPGFKGKVHLMGHSLGSAILFDLLCRQKDPKADHSKTNPLRFWPGKQQSDMTHLTAKERRLAMEFEVDDFYCLGSPIGLFEMLEGRTIAARQAPKPHASDDVLQRELEEVDLATRSMGNSAEGIPHQTLSSTQVSSPKARQVFNIFHPSDPISYRLEPLISPAMRSLKPQGLPYTKKGIFDAANEGLTGIGAKVGQSVSGLWSSLSAGIASNMLNRSLGLTSEEVAQMTDHTQSVARQSASFKSTDAASKALADESRIGERTDERKKQLADSATSNGKGIAGGNDPTLIDDELETLFSQFQKRGPEPASKDDADGGLGGPDGTRKAKKMRAEEAKVRALNRNGRVDYSIQESVLDFNPINTIASHMGYWSDVDVNHFILSQLLSSRSGPGKTEASQPTKAT